MKKILTISTVLLASLSLAACGNNNQQAKSNSSLRAENSSLKAKESAKSQKSEVKLSNAQLALAAYLKTQNQTVNDLQNNSNNMNWVKRSSNTFAIDFGAHTTTMTVQANNVEVTYDKAENGQMGQANGHKIYSKNQLIKQFGKQKGTIQSILDAHNSNSSNSSSTNISSASNNSSSNTNDSNNVSQKKSVTENGKTYTPEYDGDGNIKDWRVTDSEGHTFVGGDPSPYWQQKAQEIQGN